MWDVTKDITDYIDQEVASEFVVLTKYIESFYNPSITIKMEDYPKDTQMLLKKIVNEEGTGLIDKNDLKKYGSVNNVWDMVFSPIGQVSNTLGQFTVTEGANKTKQVTDKYDWNAKDYEEMSYLGHGFRNTLGKLSYEYGATRSVSNKQFNFPVQ